MASRFSCLFLLWPLASLKTSPDRLHFVPLFLNLFCLYKFVLLFLLNLIRLVFRTAFGGPWYLAWGWCPSFCYGLGTSFLLLYIFGFEVLRGSRACSVGVLHFLLFPLFPCLSLRTSMGPGCSSVLRIGSNLAKASSL